MSSSMGRGSRFILSSGFRQHASLRPGRLRLERGLREHIGYGGPPPYPGPYDPYQVYQAGSYRTNGLAIASLITSIAGIPLSFLCYLGLPLAIAGIVLGIVSLSQVNRTPQQGRGLAIAGIAIGSITVTLLLASIAVLAVHHPAFIGG